MRTSAPHDRFWGSPRGWASIGLIGIATYYLLAEHRAHVVPVLPWLILLACPLLHLVMHRGHGGHGHAHGSREPEGRASGRDRLERHEGGEPDAR